MIFFSLLLCAEKYLNLGQLRPFLDFFIGLAQGGQEPIALHHLAAPT